MNAVIATAAFAGLAIMALIFALIATPLTLNLLDRWARLDAKILKKMPRVKRIVDKIGLYLFGDEIPLEFPEQTNNYSKYKICKPNCINSILHFPYGIFCEFVKLKQGYQRWHAYTLQSIGRLKKTNRIKPYEPHLNGVNESLDKSLNTSSHSTQSTTRKARNQPKENLTNYYSLLLLKTCQ
ncbi:hypothetical protein ACFLYE_02395 [Chloroflexota bacterium]